VVKLGGGSNTGGVPDAPHDPGRVRYEERDGIAVLTLDRPASLNALSRAMLDGLREALGRSGRAETIRAAVLTGAGRAFSAGIDLFELEAALRRGESEAEARVRLERLQDVTRLLASSPVPVLAAVNGPAVGLGAEIAVAADLRIAAEDAFFSFPETRRGLSGTNGVSYLLPRLVGTGRALDWMLTGRKVEAREALAAGLVSAIVPGEVLLDAADEWAGWIAAAPAGGSAAARRLLAEPLAAGLEEALEREVDAVLERMRSPEYVSGVRAFVERRGPTPAPPVKEE